MSLFDISKSTPLEPEIELDGGYSYCARCKNELKEREQICPKCHQLQDWYWLKKW